MKKTKDFSQLGLKKDIVVALNNLNITKATEVQETLIPKFQLDKHIVFTSQTGSGKTLCYLLGYLPKINLKMDLQMLVVVPTRELAEQVAKEIKRVTDQLGVNVGVLFGGRDIKGDFKTVTKRNHIMVGTPGRLIEHINKKTLKVGDVKYLVFDESDQMFDNGFARDCGYIKFRCAKDVKIILSSATITEKVDIFLENEFGDESSYELIKIGDKIPKNIVQEKVFVEIEDKPNLLVNCINKLQKEGKKQIIVFTNTKERCFLIKENLQNNKIHATELHGDFTLRERNNHLNGFTSGRVRVLITTNVAARGLHIPKVDAVINYDVSTRSEFYVHRIGRSGRIQEFDDTTKQKNNAQKKKKGYAITFICSEDLERFETIEEMYKIKVVEVDHEFNRVYD